jgi:hypothetical protein
MVNSIKGVVIVIKNVSYSGKLGRFWKKEILMVNIHPR